MSEQTFADVLAATTASLEAAQDWQKHLQATCYGTGSTSGSTLTLNDVNTMVLKVEDILRRNPEPIGEYMRSRGCPPDKWVMVLPKSLREFAGPYPPNYVKFSEFCQQPMLVKFADFFPLRSLK